MIKYIKNNLLTVFVLVITAAGLSACGTPFKSDNPMLQTDKNAPYALVYFIRPRPERTMGMADNVIKIELDKQPFMSLPRGEYISTRLVPGEIYITLNSQTTYGPEHRIKKMSKTRSFAFSAGQTYYLAILPVDGEFRGVYFIAREVDHDTAVAMTSRARPAAALFGDTLK